jgi:hypothetical protein|tara:strand:- start:507 stop:1028 length:522 start_codon:yes stop_codon:yes gene_type:complete
MGKLRKLVKDFWSKALAVLVYAAIIVSCGIDSSGEITSDDIYFDDGYNKNVNLNLPQIIFEEEDFNFGIIIEGEIVSHLYKFENTGKSDLIISNVQTSCGCTSSKDYTKKPIKPGEKGEIEIEFDSTEKSGEIKKSISVITNCNPNKSILYILGNVISTGKIKKLEKKQNEYI